MSTANKVDEESALEICGPMQAQFDEILSADALAFLVQLHREFNSRRTALLESREARQRAFDRGEKPDFLDETKEIRASEWQVAPIPEDLADRRIEITGPVDRKMIINGLNSGAKVFMADFEDASSPTWENMIGGQLNIRDAVNRTITFTKADGTEYRLADDPAVLMVRARGWHLPEKHLIYAGQVLSAGLVDFGLCFYHNAKQQLANGSGPYFYLPKLESYLEARLWNDVFNFAQDYLGIPRGTIRATVLIETIPAAFQMGRNPVGTA